MTWPAPTGKRKGCPVVRELSNCLPLLSFAAASYSQPVYCTTAIFPAVSPSPVPGLISTDCIELTPPAGAAPGLLLQAAIKPRRTTTPIFDRGLLQGIAAILKDFTVALILQWCWIAACRTGGCRTPPGRIRRPAPGNTAAGRRWRHRFHRPLVTSTPCAPHSRRASALPP